jgi:hypothetical protein
MGGRRDASRSRSRHSSSLSDSEPVFHRTRDAEPRGAAAVPSGARGAHGDRTSLPSRLGTPRHPHHPGAHNHRPPQHQASPAPTISFQPGTTTSTTMLPTHLTNILQVVTRLEAKVMSLERALTRCVVLANMAASQSGAPGVLGAGETRRDCAAILCCNTATDNDPYCSRCRMMQRIFLNGR